ncbi:MAG: sulfotransferase domain-containing protein [Acidimicrobiales bacterium]|nr:sulfotransferase domain-containing protein [Acidimicrobiales bacterium]
MASRLGLRRRVEVVSFPKSGRTWLRMMLGRVLVARFDLGDVTTLNLGELAAHDRSIPWIRFTHDDNPQDKRVVEIETDKSAFRHVPTVLLVRDPRDVVVSNFFQVHRRERGADGREATPDEVGAFMRGEVGGLASIVAHQNVWARQRAVLGDGLVVVRYEDLHADARGCLQRIAALAGLGRLTDGELDAAIDGASFGAMRDLERSGAIEHAMLRPGDAADPESFKVRRGKVGGFVDYLDADDCDFMDAYIEATLLPGTAIGATNGALWRRCPQAPRVRKIDHPPGPTAQPTTIRMSPNRIWPWMSWTMPTMTSTTATSHKSAAMVVSSLRRSS